MTVTQVNTIEYDLARTIKLLLDADDVRTLGYLVGHQEPDLINGKGPVKKLRDRLSAAGVETDDDTTSDTSEGPASFTITDPDGNLLLFDQHR